MFDGPSPLAAPLYQATHETVKGSRLPNLFFGEIRCCHSARPDTFPR